MGASSTGNRSADDGPGGVGLDGLVVEFEDLEIL